MSALEINVRPALPADLPILRSALAWAILWRASDPIPDPSAVIAGTGHAYLLADWGRPGDAAVVAEAAACLVGAAWYRYWSDDQHSYGYLDAACPELGIGVDPRYRGRGIGQRLLNALIDLAASRGVARLSLSVEGDNPALRLYERAGFVRQCRAGGSWTMVKVLAGAAAEDAPDCRNTYRRLHLSVHRRISSSSHGAGSTLRRQKRSSQK